MPDNTPLPVAGHTPQSDAKVALVNEFKADEERLLRQIDRMHDEVNQIGESGWQSRYDEYWLMEARRHLQVGFMALNRAVFQPQRIKLPEDDNG